MNISRIKNAPKDLTKDIEDNFYELIVMSYLLGILHVKENLEKQKNFADNDMIPTEAIEWMMSRASVSKEDFYNNIDPKARYKAFTISKLTSLDAIERTKELLSKTLEEGETMKEWRDRLKSDEILSKIGFHENNPFYLETVFRTNTISAYNAGRWGEIQRRKDSIAFLQYIAIDDSRTTEICSALDGTILPADDPFWKTHYPPNHFNCRSQVVEISPEEVEILGYKETDKDKIDEINGVPIPKGFDTPISASWWDETESMKKRSKKYGIDKEIMNKKNDLIKSIDKSDSKKSKYKDLQKVYENEKNGGYIELNINNKNKEIRNNLEVSKILVNKYGYKIKLLDTNNRKYVKSADIMINNKYIWEIKTNTTATFSAIDKLLRKGGDQSDKIIIYIKSNIDKNILKRAIYNRIRQKENIKLLMIIEDSIINQYTRDEILKWR